MSRPFATLTSRLVLTAVLLVALVSLLVGVATTVAMRDYLTGQLDAKVLQSASRERGPGPDDARPPPQELPTGEPVFFGNQEPGTLIARITEGDGYVLSQGFGEAETLDDGTVAALGDVPTDGRVHSVEVPGHGEYRVIAIDSDLGLVVTGLPTSDVDESVASLVRLELALGLLAVVLAVIVGTALVRRQLRPLTEVAQTAHRVADLPLSHGDTEITERVPEHLTREDTEVGQVGAALNTLLAHVELSLDARQASEQRVRQFVADASHELRTPLTTIAGYTELARRRPDDPATAATALAKVEEESARMTALVEDLLLLARLDSGRPLARDDVDLTRLLLEAVSDARVVAPEHRWRLELPEDAVEVRGDEQRLHQVVTNLLTNARKYTPPGTTVTVTAHPGGFSVHDDGPGFPPDLIDTAFERFARGDASRHREGGVGLGLALVQAIVAAHGGSVRLASRPGDTRIDVALD